MADDQPYQLRDDVVAIHRSIGHFITGFAGVDQALRNGMGRFLSGDAPGESARSIPSSALLDILIDRMTAGAMQSAFLSMSSAVAELDDQDKAVRNALGNVLRYFVRVRNDIAHARWDVGWSDAETGAPVLPTARKVRVSKEGPESVALGALDADSIARDARNLHTVERAVGVYVEGCLYLRAGEATKRPGKVLEVVSARHPVGQIVLPKAESA